MARRPEVGDTFTHERTCDPYRPHYYAGASGDFNPIHIDPEVGRAAGLAGNILQGMCTMAWAVEAALKAAPDVGRLRRIRVRFTRPVAPGDTVRFDGRVGEVSGDGVTLELSARNQRGEDVLKVTRAELSAP